jgi:hypothetical protein
MPRITLKKVALSALVLALFAPVYLFVGSPAFRPSWAASRFVGIPVTVLWVLILFVTFVGLTWIFSREAFADEGDGK